MMVQGTPSDLDWDLYLDSWDRQEQNAYHEFMIVMQADEDKGFSLERLELSGNTTDPRWYWWDTDSTMSIAVNDIQISRPEIDLEDYQGGNNGNHGNNTNPQNDDTEDDDAANGDLENAGTGSSTTTNINVEVPAAQGCSTTGNRTAPLGLALALGLVALGGRRED
jgi:hypothetical protein